MQNCKISRTTTTKILHFHGFGDVFTYIAPKAWSMQEKK
jgi:hypothetical protein